MAAVRLPRISNSTDVEALACEPGVLVRWITDPADLADADVVVLPGSKSTVSDLGWLRECGLADGIVAACRGGPDRARGVRRVPDAVPGHRRPRRVEASVSSTDSACSTPTSSSTPDKTLRALGASLCGLRDPPRSGRPQHRQTDWLGASAFGAAPSSAPTGTGCSTTTTLRRQWLTDAAAAAGRAGFVVADDVDVAECRDRQLDLMADLLAAHLDVDAVMDLFDHGAPPRPTIATALRGYVTSVHEHMALARGPGAHARRRAVRLRSRRSTGTPTWPGARLAQSVLTAADFPTGVQYDRIVEEPGRPDGQGGPPCDAVQSRRGARTD